MALKSGFLHFFGAKKLWASTTATAAGVGAEEGAGAGAGA